MYYTGADEIWILGGIQAVAAMAGGTDTMPADEHADSFTVAIESLSYAEHGPDTAAVLITTSEKIGIDSIKIVDKLLEILPAATLAGMSWKTLGETIVVPTLDEVFKLADDYASEHVQILTQHPREALEKLQNCNALFLGEKTCDRHNYLRDDFEGIKQGSQHSSRLEYGSSDGSGMNTPDLHPRDNLCNVCQ
ncbi:MAG: hypothetical protein ALECFALPRED_007978 [Alectoria fallacina]|uniref:Uncharacterized protein n=1 Tax=Alectoria fallacina TaxID=1903189 RepID=A0A8H3J1R5_9LECA|nr:MAG: hypothetical protein ALECFALPRED_007978 [Alectoria fallacina]